MPIIVLEGIDGSGKSTQIALLKKNLQSLGHQVATLHFPRLDEPIYGHLIQKYLQGDFGPLHSLPPQILALLFAGNRHQATNLLLTWLKEGKIVLLDRYYASNLAYQGAMIEEEAMREEFLNRVLRMELEHFAIPKANFTFYLDLDSTCARQLLNLRMEQRATTLDINEVHRTYQERVRQIFLSLDSKLSNYYTISCFDDEGLRTPEAIHEDICSHLHPLLGLKEK